jgi:dethiobiotin synthetase
VKRNFKPAVPGLFVTGTDTGIGKTYVAATIVRELAAAGHRVGVYKPVASGCRRDGNALVSDDAMALWVAAGRPGTLEAVCPQRCAAALVPHLAAQAEERHVDADLLRSGLDFWMSSTDVMIVEGVGGLLSPVTADEYVADLAHDFGWPLVVVTPNRLGTIHQTLATLVVAATFRDGLDVAGVILNEPSSDAQDGSVSTNYDELRRRCVPPVLGRLRWQATQIEPKVDWFRLACRAGE